MQCQLIINGSLADIIEVCSLLAPVADKVMSAGPLPRPIEAKTLHRIDNPEPGEQIHSGASPALPPAVEQKRCTSCGEPFTPSKKQKLPYCTTKCYMKEWHKNKKEQGGAASISNSKRNNFEKHLNDNKSPFKKEKKPVISDNYGGLY